MTQAHDERRAMTGEAHKRLKSIGKVVLVGSGKGGVGKSFVAASLATLLAEEGNSTGLLDIDIHGASAPNYLGVKPPLKSGRNGLEPKRTHGLKVMSVGLFTGNNPVPVRGKDKQGLITQLFALTDWGALDYLVVDLPPSMGDELLTAFSLFGEKGKLILVTTPSKYSLTVVSLLRKLAEREGIPVSGLVLNMSYIKSGAKKIFPLGRPSRALVERSVGATVIAEIPFESSLGETSLRTVLKRKGDVRGAVREICAAVSG